MKKLLILIILIMLITSLSVSAAEITDMRDRNVTVPDNVTSIIGMNSGTLRLLVYLQATDLLIGIEEMFARGGRPYTFAHPELLKLPTIGLRGNDPEAIAALNPEVIFTTYMNESRIADNMQNKTGSAVVCIDYGDLDNNIKTFFAALRLMGEVLNKEDRVEEVITFFEDTIKDLDDRTKNNKSKETVYVGGVSQRGSHGIDSTEPDYAPFAFVNANNVASSVEAEHAYIDPEQLLIWNADKIFIDYNGYNLVMEDFKNKPVLKLMKAVRNDELYFVLPYNWYTTNYGTVLANAYYIGKVLYPDSFADIDPGKKADEIYEFLVGKPVYDEMIQLYGPFGKAALE